MQPTSSTATPHHAQRPPNPSSNAHAATTTAAVTHVPTIKSWTRIGMRLGPAFHAVRGVVEFASIDQHVARFAIPARHDRSVADQAESCAIRDAPTRMVLD